MMERVSTDAELLPVQGVLVNSSGTFGTRDLNLDLHSNCTIKSTAPWPIWLQWTQIKFLLDED